jgi:hypothetical protein
MVEMEMAKIIQKSQIEIMCGGKVFGPCPPTSSFAISMVFENPWLSDI